jgi:hypothetical protein
MSKSRLHVYLSEPQLAWLTREAERIGISTSELLRRIIDQVRESK